MSKDGSVGRSNFTPVKNDFFRSFISAHLSITHGCLEKYRDWVNPNFLYFDLCAGDGQTYPDGTESSPIIFLTEASKYSDINFFIRLVEIDKISSQKLEQAIIPYITKGDNCLVLNMDNLDFLKMPTETMFSDINQKGKYYGIMYLDPNGSNLPLPEMTNFLDKKDFSYMDVLINRNCTAAKRINGYRPGTKETVYDIVDMLPKKIWYIREPETQHQFSLMYGTNFMWDPLRRLLDKWNFYDAKSDEGDALMTYLSNPKVHYSLPIASDKCPTDADLVASLESTINEFPLGISIVPNTSKILEYRSCFDKDSENFGDYSTLTSYDDKSTVYEINSDSDEKALSYYRGLVEQFYRNNYREAEDKIAALDSMDSLPSWDSIEAQYMDDVQAADYGLHSQNLSEREILIELKKDFPSEKGFAEYKIYGMRQNKKSKDLLEVARLKDKVDKRLYLLRDQGLSARTISKKLKKEFPFVGGIGETSVYEKIKRRDMILDHSVNNSVSRSYSKKTDDPVSYISLNATDEKRKKIAEEFYLANYGAAFSSLFMRIHMNSLDFKRYTSHLVLQYKEEVKAKVYRLYEMGASIKDISLSLKKEFPFGTGTSVYGVNKAIMEIMMERDRSKEKTDNVLKSDKIFSVEIAKEQDILEDIKIPNNGKPKSDNSQTVIFTGAFRPEIRSKLIKEIKDMADAAWNQELELRQGDIDRDTKQYFNMSKFE